MRGKIAAMSVLAAAVGAHAQQDVTFVFEETGERDLTFAQFTEDGVTLTIDNPRGNDAFGDNTFAFILGGLFVDGGLAPNLDFTFSEDVRLVEYTLGNNEVDETFDLVQGNVSSLDNTTDSADTFPFTNTTDIFSGGEPIELLSSNNDAEGYSFASITVRTIPAPGSAALFGLAGLVAARRRRA